jgi:hypothetical protein
VGEYCRQMKGLADSLRNLGEPVADRTLVLNLLCGLSPCYDHLKALIKRTVPFPTFHVVRNELLLEELTMTHDAPTLAVVLYSTIPSAQVSPRGQPPPPPARAPSTRTHARPPPSYFSFGPLSTFHHRWQSSPPQGRTWGRRPLSWRSHRPRGRSELVIVLQPLDRHHLHVAG